MKKVVVIGAGAAGMMAAITAAQSGASVTLIEKNEKTGKKIFITGKGRCNVTNGCEHEEFFENIVTNSKFLYSAYAAFDNRSMMELLKEAGSLKGRAGQTDFSAVRPFLGCHCRIEPAIEEGTGEGAFSYGSEGAFTRRASGRSAERSLEGSGEAEG